MKRHFHTRKEEGLDPLSKSKHDSIHDVIHGPD